MADATLSDIVEEVAAEDGVRKVQVEIIHKHEERSSANTWAIAIGVVLILGIGLFYIAENSDGLLSGDDSIVGNCADNVDNDNDGLKDAQDPGCRPNGQYDEEGFEHTQ
ncbi:MAG TPA: hypothetical protein QF716_02105 [Candidatus Thalassarchaeaceae archaeon]|jgi:hypothetical protein|nr:hypothetical protein [Candidatus Thalassarchaeaceae archaeon]HJM67654.1 hypothetical protein [Candidatus Thalassarchaeaceae archaeon]